MFSIVRRRINYRLIATRLTSTNTSASSTGGATAEEAKPASNDVVLELQKQLEVKALEVSELKDLYRRSIADAQSLRIRTQKEIQQKEEFAIQKFAKDLLTTADYLSLALTTSTPDSTTEKRLNDLTTGVSLTQKELLKTLAGHGVVAFDALGTPFDFNKHTAIFQSSVEGKTAGTVFHVDKVGYMIGERVLRAAAVGVVKEKE